MVNIFKLFQFLILQKSIFANSVDFVCRSVVKPLLLKVLRDLFEGGSIVKTYFVLQHVVIDVRRVLYFGSLIRLSELKLHI